MGKLIEAKARFRDPLAEVQEAAAVELEDTIAWLGQVVQLFRRESDRIEAEERLRGLVFVRSVYPPHGRMYAEMTPDQGA